MKFKAICCRATWNCHAFSPGLAKFYFKFESYKNLNLINIGQWDLFRSEDVFLLLLLAELSMDDFNVSAHRPDCPEFGLASLDHAIHPNIQMVHQNVIPPRNLSGELLSTSLAREWHDRLVPNPDVMLQPLFRSEWLFTGAIFQFKRALELWLFGVDFHVHVHFLEWQIANFTDFGLWQVDGHQVLSDQEFSEECWKI